MDESLSIDGTTPPLVDRRARRDAAAERTAGGSVSPSSGSHAGKATSTSSARRGTFSGPLGLCTLLAFGGVTWFGLWRLSSEGGMSKHQLGDDFAQHAGVSLRLTQPSPAPGQPHGKPHPVHAGIGKKIPLANTDKQLLEGMSKGFHVPLHGPTDGLVGRGSLDGNPHGRHPHPQHPHPHRHHPHHHPHLPRAHAAHPDIPRHDLPKLFRGARLGSGNDTSSVIRGDHNSLADDDSGGSVDVLDSSASDVVDKRADLADMQSVANGIGLERNISAASDLGGDDFDPMSPVALQRALSLHSPFLKNYREAIDEGWAKDLMRNPFPDAPGAQFMDTQNVPVLDSDEDVDQTLDDDAPGLGDGCVFKKNVDYIGEDVGTVSGLTKKSCCALCQSKNEENLGACTVAVMSSSSDDPPEACWLKRNVLKTVKKVGVTACVPPGDAPSGLG